MSNRIGAALLLPERGKDFWLASPKTHVKSDRGKIALARAVNVHATAAEPVRESAADVDTCVVRAGNGLAKVHKT